MNEAAPLVSVIVPTHNRAALLRRALSSVLGQSYRNLEVIVIENACTDATADLLDTLSDPRLRRITLHEKKGASAARNEALAVANGRFVAFQDDDDIWLADKLEKQIAALASADPSVSLCLCGHLRLESDGRVEACFAQDHFDRLDFNEGLSHFHPIIATPGWVAPREALLEVGGFDVNLPARNDWELALRLRDRGPFLYIAEPLFIQDQTRATTMARNEAAHCQAIRHIDAMYADRWKRHPDVAAAHARIIGRYEVTHGDTAEGRRWLRRALQLQPERLRTWALYLSTLLPRRWTRTAVSVYQRLWLRLSSERL